MAGDVSDEELDLERVQAILDAAEREEKDPGSYGGTFGKHESFGASPPSTRAQAPGNKRLGTGTGHNLLPRELLDKDSFANAPYMHPDGKCWNLSSIVNNPEPQVPAVLEFAFAPEPFALPPSTHNQNTPASVATLKQYKTTIGKAFRRARESRERKVGGKASAMHKLKSPAEYRQEMEACLSKIPAEYRKPDFKVMKSSELERHDFSQSTITLTRLSHYLDLVEVNLLRQIYSRSNSFFTALSNIKEIHKEVATYCDRIEDIRKSMRHVEKSLVSASVNVWGTTRQRRQRELLELLERIHATRNSQAMVRSLLDLGDYFGAIKLIQETQSLLESKLKGVKCLKDIPEKLGQDLRLIGKLLEGEFLDLSTRLPEPEAADAAFESDDRLTRVIKVLHSINLARELPRKLRQAYKDLIVSEIKGSLQEELCKLFEARKTFANPDPKQPPAQTQPQSQAEGQQQDPEKNEPAAPTAEGPAEGTNQPPTPSGPGPPPPKGASDPSEPPPLPVPRPQTNGRARNSTSNLGSDIVSLSHAEFMALSGPLFELLVRVARRIRRVEILGRTALATDSNSEQEPGIRDFLKEIKQVVRSSCEYALSRVMKILDLRKSQHSELKLVQLRALFQKCLEFVAAVEEIASTKLYDIRNGLINQTKGFLDRFHEIRRKKLREQLSKEKWEPVKIPMKYQHLIENDFVPPKEGDPQSVVPTRKACWWRQDWDVDEGDVGDEPSEKRKATSSRSGPPPRTNGAMLDAFVLTTSENVEERFRVVQSLLSLLGFIQEYVECAIRVQPIGVNVVHKLVELVKTYNSRTCELILGAGAMKTAGLKRIQAKHLSLSARSVFLLLEILPHVRKVLSDKLPRQSRVVVDQLFDGLKKDLTTHRNQVFRKIVEIIDKLASQKGDQLSKMKWANPSTQGSEESNLQNLRPDDPVSELMKHTKQLHKVLTNYLGPNQRDHLFKEIAETLVTSLTKCLQDLDLGNTVIKHRIQVNVKFVVDRLSRLESVTDNVQIAVRPFVNLGPEYKLSPALQAFRVPADPT